MTKRREARMIGVDPFPPPLPASGVRTRTGLRCVAFVLLAVIATGGAQFGSSPAGAGSEVTTSPADSSTNWCSVVRGAVTGGRCWLVPWVARRRLPQLARSRPGVVPMEEMVDS